MTIRTFFLTLACLFMVSEAHAAPEVVSGGVSDEGEAQIDSIQNHYSLKITFVGIGGIYLDAINVTIDDKFGNRQVNMTTDGPILLADLAPGRYTVNAEVEGRTIRQTIQVGKGLKQYTLRFPIGE